MNDDDSPLAHKGSEFGHVDDTGIVWWDVFFKTVIIIAWLFCFCGMIFFAFIHKTP